MKTPISNLLQPTLAPVYDPEFTIKVIWQQQNHFENLTSLEVDFPSTVPKIAFVFVCVWRMADGQRKWSGSSASYKLSRLMIAGRTHPLRNTRHDLNLSRTGQCGTKSTHTQKPDKHLHMCVNTIAVSMLGFTDT